MVFFASIGILTIAWIIYDLTKYIFIDCPKQEEEEARAMIQDTEDDMLPEEFTFDRSEDQLYNRVFDLVTYDSNDVVAPINRSLKKIGSYIRLYYYLIATYSEFIDEDPNIRIATYRIELLRRELQNKISSVGGNIDNGLRLELNSASKTILIYGSPIIETYDRTRDWCLSRKLASKVDQLDRIYQVLDTEKTVFRGYPETGSYYAKSGQTYLTEVFHDETAAQKAQPIRNTATGHST